MNSTFCFCRGGGVQSDRVRRKMSLVQDKRDFMRARLSDCLKTQSLEKHHSLIALPSNISAIETMERFINGSCNQIALRGPSGWGKSLLLQEVARKMTIHHGLPVDFLPAIEWSNKGVRLDCQAPLILDDVQGILMHPRARHTFKLKIEWRQRTNRKTLIAFSSESDIHAIKLAITQSNTWEFTNIFEPKSSERFQITMQLAQRCGMTISHSVAHLISIHLNGNGHSIVGALQTLKLIKTDWSQETDVMSACGFLSPYLIGKNGWDPRDQVFDAIQAVHAKSQIRFSKSAMTSYFLLKELGLSESDIASFLKISPGLVYKRAKEIEGQLSDHDVQLPVYACRNAILLGFREE